MVCEGIVVGFMMSFDFHRCAFITFSLTHKNAYKYRHLLKVLLPYIAYLYLSFYNTSLSMYSNVDMYMNKIFSCFVAIGGACFSRTVCKAEIFKFYKEMFE